MKKILFFDKVKFPKLINRIGKGQKVENELPTKRKRANSRSSTGIADSDVTIVQQQQQPVRHKLRRTKKNENLRDEWKKYHNNFIPVISSESTLCDIDKTLNASSTIENTNMNSFTSSISNSHSSISHSIEHLKYSIRNTIINSNNNSKTNGKTMENEKKEQHVNKKRRLLSFIPI
ncbi:hypothetical protein BCR36DRAFT_579925 [Piromyces finnis]|uniref:Uncharacterized protein n=1 Tax=Piromyces finnis TaxID=1754191 RepID=A0A1Y1VLM5_9FUNG|nr:hypothetical protein BCR36DRAFT_579925 [Piromyces finnis]|eukprot:ORX59342.1 hypothetical protein BCR36DRAFT_579925 [Piromyces finnis]